MHDALLKILSEIQINLFVLILCDTSPYLLEFYSKYQIKE